MIPLLGLLLARATIIAAPGGDAGFGNLLLAWLIGMASPFIGVSSALIGLMRHERYRAFGWLGILSNAGAFYYGIHTFQSFTS